MANSKESQDPDDGLNDLLSQRLGSDDEPAADETVPLSQDTVRFDAFAQPGRAGAPQSRDASAPASEPDSTSTAKPAMFSDEEWALISGTEVPDNPKAASATAADTTQVIRPAQPKKQPTKPAKPKKATRPTKQAAQSPSTTKRSPLDVIGTLWFSLTMPLLVMAIAVRAVASGWFLRMEYHWRPGFPEDTYGFSADERLHYGSYVVDYLHNQADEKYLSNVVTEQGTQLLQPEEIAHMVDVKGLMQLLFAAGLIATLGMVVFGLYMCRPTGPGLRVALRIAAIVNAVLLVGVGVLAALRWETFFNGFHALFFREGTWVFYLDDVLIRLFPPQFWSDAGVVIGVVALGLTAFALALSFAGKRRKDRA